MLHRLTCACSPCTTLNTLAARTREPPTTALYETFRLLGSCAQSGRSYRAGLRNTISRQENPRLLAQLDLDSVEDATTMDIEDPPVELEPLPLAPMSPVFPLEPMSPLFCDVPLSSDTLPGLPHWLDVVGWSRVEDIETCLYPFYTGNTRELHKHPLNDNCWTVFTREKHEYYIDGILRNAPKDPNKWLSPSVFIHILWYEFDAFKRSDDSANRQLKKLCRTLLAPQDIPTGTRDLPSLWKLALNKVGTTRLPDEAWKLFQSNAALKEPGLVRKKIDDAIALERMVSGKISPSATSVVNHLAADLRTAWDENRDSGSERHESFDKNLQKIPLSPTDRKIPLGFYRAFAKYLPKYDIFQTEFLLTDRARHLIGVADFMLIDRETGELILCDFKNCKDEDLFHQWDPKARGIHPFTANMPDSKAAHYTFQLSFYRDILNRLYYPGRLSTKMLLLNFRPADPDTFDDMWIDALDMTEFMSLCPWKKDDPRHVLSGLIPGFPDNDPRAIGSVTRIRVPRQGDTLPDDVVWTGHAYNKSGPPLPDSPWKYLGERWFQRPPKSVAIAYEAYLRNTHHLLALLPTLKGKRIACWCDESKPDWRCNADVLVKYANLYENGAFVIPPPPSDDSGSGRQTTIDTFFAKKKRKRTSDASDPHTRPKKIIAIDDNSF